MALAASLVVALSTIVSFGVASAGAAGNSPTTTTPKQPAKTAAPKKNVVTFGTQTASATKVDGRASYAFAGTPGGEVSDHVAVRNFSLQPITLSLKGTDLVNTAQGAISAVPVYEQSKDLGTWIHLPPADQTVRLKARQTLIVPFTVQVPKNATPGDHFAAVTATLQGSAVSKTGEHIKLLQTTGTRVFLRVSGPLHPHLSVTHLQIHYDGPLSPAAKGQATVTYTVTNDGNVGLGGRQTVYMHGMFGTKASAVKVPQLQLLLPGYAVKETETVKGIIPEILETAHVSIAALYIAGTQDPPAGPFKASHGFSAIPWITLGILVVILATLIYRWRRRRRIRKGKGKDAPKDPAGSGEATAQPVESEPAESAPAGSEPASTEVPSS